MPSQLDENPRHVRHVGEAREELTAKVKKAYELGASIRDLAEEHGLSYGKIHRLLSEAGVQLRGRGGPRRGGLTRIEALEYRRNLGNSSLRKR